MAEGKHCPECGEDIGYWAVVRGFFTVRCPHCRTRLRYSYTPGMSRATTLVAITSVFVGLTLGVLTGVILFQSSVVFVAVLAGGVVWIHSALGIGFVAHFALAPVLRRTQTLIADDAETPADEDTW